MCSKYGIVLLYGSSVKESTAAKKPSSLKRIHTIESINNDEKCKIIINVQAGYELLVNNYQICNIEAKIKDINAIAKACNMDFIGIAVGMLVITNN